MSSVSLLSCFLRYVDAEKKLLVQFVVGELQTKFHIIEDVNNHIAAFCFLKSTELQRSFIIS